jgi:hypothetical protein
MAQSDGGSGGDVDSGEVVNEPLGDVGSPAKLRLGAGTRWRT